MRKEVPFDIRERTFLKEAELSTSSEVDELITESLEIAKILSSMNIDLSKS